MNWNVFREIISIISDVLGIASIFISIIFWFGFGLHKKEKERQRTLKIKSCRSIFDTLESNRNDIRDHNIRGKGIRSSTREQLYKLKENSELKFKRRELKRINSVLTYLDNSAVDCDLSPIVDPLDFLVGKFNVKGDMVYG